MTLQQYLTLVQKDAQWCASQLGVTPAAVRRYLRGTRQPRPEIIHAIVALTNGAVDVKDLIKPAQVAEKTAPRHPA